MKVVLGMSGGTDSSVAAILLQEAGYEVIGVTFRFYEYGGSTEYLEDAAALAHRLGIEHIVIDARTLFRKQIIRYFIDEYMAGHTPVPCTLCNNYLKWPLLARLADERGIYAIATGHYVQKVFIDGLYYVTGGVDADKDQSFFLWGLKQEILSRMTLPLGAYTKEQVRTIAAQRGFQKVAQKKDSLGVCFCPMDYRSFLKSELPAGAITAGRFYDEKGVFLGHHEGYPFYTIGQRRGLGIQLNRAVFVKDIDPVNNKVILGDLHSLEKKEFYLKDWNCVDEEELLNRDDIVVKIRYRKQSNSCRVVKRADDKLHVQLHQVLTAVSPGQAAAFYAQDGRVLGGGIIV